MNGTVEDSLRVGGYGLLASLLRDSPEQDLLDRLEQIDLSDHKNKDDLAHGLEFLKLSARQSEPMRLREEYNDLFIGIGRGEIVPYGSWYITGFLMEQPLSILRQDLQRLGFERQESTHEPEDHVAALFEVMAMVLTTPELQIEQTRFFQSHISPWIERFFVDLEQAKSACFYKSVGQFGRAFVQFEKQYFEMQQ